MDREHETAPDAGHDRVLEHGIELTPVKANFGAEVIGIDLRESLSEETVSQLNHALLSYRFLLFREQSLNPSDQVRLSRLFGDLETFPPHPLIDQNHPEVYPVSNIASRGFTEVGRYWHADGSFRPRPTVLSFFHMIEAPSRYGETSYADMYAALEALPQTLRDIAGELKTVHGNGVVHSLLRKHEDTDRQALFVNLGMIVGLTRPDGTPMGISPKESREALAAIGATLDSSEIHYRHRWNTGDLVIADNRCVAHKAHEAPLEYPRLLHRTTTRGTDRVS